MKFIVSFNSKVYFSHKRNEMLEISSSKKWQELVHSFSINCDGFSSKSNAVIKYFGIKLGKIYERICQTAFKRRLKNARRSSFFFSRSLSLAVMIHLTSGTFALEMCACF